jgi:hypothetical protein
MSSSFRQFRSFQSSVESSSPMVATRQTTTQLRMRAKGSLPLYSPTSAMNLETPTIIISRQTPTDKDLAILRTLPAKALAPPALTVSWIPTALVSTHPQVVNHITREVPWDWEPTNNMGCFHRPIIIPTTTEKTICLRIPKNCYLIHWLLWLQPCGDTWFP